MNMPNRCAGIVIHSHAIKFGGHAPATPQIAIHIHAETIRRFTRLTRHEDAALTQRFAIRADIKGQDIARISAAFDDV